jgi:hypothetical protein
MIRGPQGGARVAFAVRKASATVSRRPGHDVHPRLQHRIREALRSRQFLDLEVAAAE